MSAYKALSEKRQHIRLVGCIAHLRRKFKEAPDAMPKKDQQAKKISRSEQALNMIRNLYAIEQRIKDKSEEERYRSYQKVETAKAKGLEPFAWLTYVLKQLPELGPDDSVDYLLPMNLTPQDIEK